MKTTIKKPVLRDDISKINKKAAERAQQTYNKSATLRYMANDFSEVLFKSGNNIEMSIDRPKDQPGIIRVEITDYQDDRLKAEVLRRVEKKDQKAPVTYGDSKVADSFEEALQFIKNESGLDVAQMIEDDMVFEMGVL